MHAARRRYHLAVRHLLCDQDNLRNAKLADLLVNCRSNEFWCEVKHAICASSVPRFVINGHTTPVSFAKTFKDQYAAVVRSGFINEGMVNNFCESLDIACVNSTCPCFDFNEVFMACLQLKNNEKDANGLLSSNAVINSSLPFFDFLCMLINMAIRHGHVPFEWHSGTIIPLLKAGNLDKSSLSSRRPITLSSLFGKVIDLLVLSRYQETFCSSDLQFSFKSQKLPFNQSLYFCCR